MKEPGEHWRVFIAIELPSVVRKSLSDHINRLRKALPDVHASFSREENLHLTLKFLGNTPVSKTEALSQAAQRAAGRFQPFDLMIGSCGAFPPRGQPRVLWIGIDDPSGQLAELQRTLEDECAKAGFVREERLFHPHLTITRLRKPQGSRELARLHGEIGFAYQDVIVSDIVLFRSELLPAGSRHTAISRHRFG